MIINQEIKSQKTSIATEVKYLYFITNANRTAIEIGITEDIIQFSKTHKIKPDLFEGYTDIISATRINSLSNFFSPFNASEKGTETICLRTEAIIISRSLFIKASTAATPILLASTRS